MRRLTLALILLALAPAGGFAQASYFEDLPEPPQLEMCAPCFDSISEYLLFIQDLPALPPEPESWSEGSTPATDPWENLRDLRKGQNIRILHVNSQTVDARFLGVSDNKLDVEANRKPVTLAREDVVMVTLKPPSKANRILLGILGGALTGFSVWAGTDRQVRGCWDDEGYYCDREDGLSSRSAVISSAAGAGIGAVIASFVKADELVIYFNQWRTAAPDAPSDHGLLIEP